MEIASSTPAQSPLQWGESLSAAPVISINVGGPAGALFRHWTGVDGDMCHPALSEAFVSLHLGGPKRLFRTGEGKAICADAKLGAISLVPAGAAYSWRTEGPIDFAHLYLASDRMDRLTAQEFDREWRSVHLNDPLGVYDAFLGAMLTELLGAAQHPGAASGLYQDSLTHVILMRLLRTHSQLAGAPLPAPHTMAPVRLRRVLDFIETSLAIPLRLNELADIAGCSPSHFSHAFTQAKGTSPYAYVIQRRIALAEALIRDTPEPLGKIALRCGFHSVRQLSRMFKRERGVTPAAYRRSA